MWGNRMAKKKATEASVSRPFFEYLWSFYRANRGQIRFSYKDLTKRLLDFNNPENAGAFLRSLNMKPSKCMSS